MESFDTKHTEFTRDDENNDWTCTRRRTRLFQVYTEPENRSQRNVSARGVRKTCKQSPCKRVGGRDGGRKGETGAIDGCGGWIVTFAERRPA